MNTAPHRQVVEFVTQQEPFFYEPDEVSMITQKQLKESLKYCPDSGLFTRKLIFRGVSIGDVAGTKDKDGYIVIGINWQRYKAHRLAFLYMTGAFPKEHTDHINGIRDDNRWLNIRCVTNSENLKNQKRSIKNTSGITGVSWVKAIKKWNPRIKSDGKRIHLGYFVDFFDACCARKSAEIKYDYHPNHGRN